MKSPEQQRRDEDWSLLGSQVVGGENFKAVKNTRYPSCYCPGHWREHSQECETAKLILKAVALEKQNAELAAQIERLKDGLRNFVGVFTQGDIGSSAGEMCVGDVVNAVELLNESPSSALSSLLGPIVEKIEKLKERVGRFTDFLVLEVDYIDSDEEKRVQEAVNNLQKDIQ